MPDRMIRDGWKTSPKIAKISEGAEVLLLRLTLCACNLSRYLADPAMIQRTAYPNRPRLRTSDIALRLDELEKAGLIARYVAPDQTPLLEIVDFGQVLKFGLKSPYPSRASGCKDTPGQALFELPGGPPPGPEPEPLRADVSEVKRRKAPHSPPPAGGGNPPRRFRTAERRTMRIEQIGREIAAIKTEMQDLYYPGGCAMKVLPTGAKAEKVDTLRARWDALETECDALKNIPENTGGVET